MNVLKDNLLNMMLPVLLLISINLGAQDTHPRFEECRDSLNTSEAYGNSPRGMNYFNSYRALDEECQGILRNTPRFLIHMGRELDDNFEVAINRGLTIDEASYREFNELLGRRVTREREEAIQRNRESAKARCGDSNAVDHTDRMPEARNQGRLDWCYAYSAADLASFETGEVISANNMALQNAHTINQNALDNGETVEGKVSEHVGGWTDEALRNGANEMCLEEEVPSGLYEQEQAGDATAVLSDLGENVEGESQPPTALSIMREFDETMSGLEGEAREEFARSFCLEHQKMLKEQFPNGFESGVVDTLVNLTAEDSFDELTYGQCQTKVELPESSGEPTFREFNNEENPQESIQNIDEVLSNGGIIEVTYYPDALGQADQDEETGEFGLHSSTIIGRQWNEEAGSCQYLLRNSWGADCDNTYSEYSGVTCASSNGASVWINEDQLARHTTSTTFFDRYVDKDGE